MSRRRSVDRTEERCYRPDIRVACILDDFSYHCFRHECLLEPLHRSTWKKQLKKCKPDFLLVESAWMGTKGSWRGQVAGLDKNPDSELKRLIRYCKRCNIPTVFWNKEDEPHYQLFIETAKLFDHVFTTDANCLKRYRQELGHNRVAVLPFAAQSAIHNPVGNQYAHKRNVAFAGTWYADKYPQRAKDLHMLLTPALDWNLHIYDRKNKSRLKSFSFPGVFQGSIRGELSYDEMSQTYKKYKIFLNVNSVQDSPTMFSRRVFEILASGTNVISSYSKGIQRMFGELVPISRGPEETELLIRRLLQDTEFSQRLSLLGIREVHSKHLYRHRFQRILKVLGLPGKSEPGVSVIAFVHTLDEYNRVEDCFLRQKWKKKELLVVYQGEFTDLEHLQRQCERVSGLTVIHMPVNESAMKCVSIAVKQARFEYISFFQPGDTYEPFFLTDLMHAVQYANCDMAGKLTHYLYASDQGCLWLCNPDQEHVYVSQLLWTAMVVKKSVFAQVDVAKFQNETFFFNHCNKQGITMYAADKYNYASVQPAIRENLRSTSKLVRSGAADYENQVTV